MFASNVLDFNSYRYQRLRASFWSRSGWTSKATEVLDILDFHPVKGWWSALFFHIRELEPRRVHSMYTLEPG